MPTAADTVRALVGRDCFKAVQFDAATCEQTGTTYFFQASTVEEAVSAATYYLGVSGAKVRQGPTGRVIYAGRHGYTITPHN